MNIFKLVGDIMVDTTKAENSIHKTESKAKNLFNTLGNGVKKTARVGAGIAAGVGAGAAAITGMANKAAEATDRVDKMSSQVGLSREGFQEWDYILSQNGASIDSMKTGFKTLADRAAEAGEGAGIGAEAFEKLGLDLDEVAQMSQEELFEETVKALQGMEEGSERAALANDLLGRSGQDLAPLLNQGADSIDELKQNAKDLGLVMSDDAIDAGVEFTDTMDDLKRSFGTAATQVGVTLMPMIQDFADWIIQNMPEIQRVMRIVFEKIGEFVGKAVDIFQEHLIPIFKEVYRWVENNWPTIAAIIEGVFEAIKWAWNNVLSPVLGFLWDLLENIVGWVSDNWPGIETTFKTVFDGIVTVVGGAIDIFTGLRDRIKEAWEWLTKWNDTDIQNGNFSPGDDGGAGGGGGGVGGRVEGSSNVEVNLNGATFVNEQQATELTDLVADNLRRRGIMR